MIFVLDNYDSFTYNLVQRLGEIDATLDIRVARNDCITIAEIEALAPERIIISPGPGTPQDAGLSREVVAHFGPRGVPVLGVCLGHQCVADAFGGRVVRTDRLMHGKTSWIHHDGRGLFTGLPNPFEATRYHSLIVPEESLPEELEVCAWTTTRRLTEKSGRGASAQESAPPADEPGQPREVMGLRHRHYPVHAVQFHPESFLTLEGYALLARFLEFPAAEPVES